MAEAATAPPDFAIALSGGGARAAYQVGLVRHLARRHPEIRFPIITGVSAGAINAAFLASRRGSLRTAAEELSVLWESLLAEMVFAVDVPTLMANAARWATRLASGGTPGVPHVRGLLDTAPLRVLLQRTLGSVDGEIPGIQENLERGLLHAAALTGLSYSTGQTVTWVQGRQITTWDRANRRAVATPLTVDHVMASAALPLLFPAVRVGPQWYGDGGIRLAAPLSPALHLGARRILAISTRYARSFGEADRPAIHGYPPPAQVVGHLLNAVFLDVLDEDVRRLRLVNTLVAKLPPAEREGLRCIDLLVLRPSVDLGRLAAEYEPRLPRAFRFLTRGLGSHQTASPDFLSLLMFQPDYLRRLIEIGEADAEARRDELAAFVEGLRVAC